MRNYDVLTYVLDHCSTPDEVRDAITAMRAAIARKAAAAKNSPRRAEAAAWRAEVLHVIEAEPLKLWAVQELSTRFEVSVPKITAALTFWKNEGKLVREETKGIPYYKFKGE